MSGSGTSAGEELVGSWRVDLARWKAHNPSKLGWLGDVLVPMLLYKAEVRFTDSTLTMQGFGNEGRSEWTYEITRADVGALAFEGARLGKRGMRMAGEIELVDRNRITVRFNAPKKQVLALRRNR